MLVNAVSDNTHSIGVRTNNIDAIMALNFPNIVRVNRKKEMIAAEPRMLLSKVNA